MVEKLIGKGNTADVYDIGDNKVLKLFIRGYPELAVQKEFQNSKLVNELGGHFVRSYERVSLDGRNGILYDKVDGVPMLDLFIQSHDIEKWANALATLHKEMLSFHNEVAISLKSILKENIDGTDRLSDNLKVKLLDMLGGLPEGSQLCHGDFHLGNVLVAGHGSYFIIDYMNVCRGHWLGDIARTVYLTEMTPIPTELAQRKGITSELRTGFTKVYLNAMGVNRETLVEWLVVTAGARLAELTCDQTDEIDTVSKFLRDNIWG